MAVKNEARKKHTNMTYNEWRWGYTMVAPTIIGLIILNIIPIFQTVYLSLFKSGDFGKGNIFVGFANYIKMFKDEQVWGATANTFIYTVIVVPITIAIAMLLAVFLSKNIKGKHIYRSIYFIPMVVAPAAVTMVWKWLYNTNFGIINKGLTALGMSSVDWINDPNVAFISIAIIGIWSTVGYSMVLLLAGLQEIPASYYEASSIDGAKPLRQFFAITLPLISPTLFFVVVTSVIQAMQVFDVIYMMVDVTSPAYDSTVSLVYLFFNNSFKYSDKGYGSAIVMLLLVIIMIITAIQLKIQKKWVQYM